MAEEIKEETKPTVPEFKKPLVKMTAVELKEVAMEIPGAVGVTAMLKADLLSLIREYYGLEDEAVEKKEKSQESQDQDNRQRAENQDYRIECQKNRRP